MKLNLGVLVVVLMVGLQGCGDDSKQSNAPSKGPVVSTAIPGEATLDLAGQKIRTKVDRVRLREQAIPGQEFTQAGEGLTFLTFNIEIRNVGKADAALGGGYKLKLPDGQEIEYTGEADGENALEFGEPLKPDATQKGTLSWEVDFPKKKSKYVLIWKPDSESKKEARFTYEHK